MTAEAVAARARSGPGLPARTTAVIPAKAGIHLSARPAFRRGVVAGQTAETRRAARR